MSHTEDPIEDLKWLQQRMSTLLEESLKRPATPAGDGPVDSWQPLSDAFETAEEFILIVEIPGVPKENVSVQVDGASLTVSGSRQLPGGFDSGNVQWIERPAGSFARTFELPATVDARRISAAQTDGLLTIRLPKRAVDNGQPFNVTVE